VGDFVYARWKNNRQKYFYRGTITELHPTQEAADLHYEDGDDEVMCPFSLLRKGVAKRDVKATVAAKEYVKTERRERVARKKRQEREAREEAAAEAAAAAQQQQRKRTKHDKDHVPARWQGQLQAHIRIPAVHSFP